MIDLIFKNGIIAIMNNILRHILIAVFIFLALASIFSVFVSPFETKKEIAISELAAQINEEKVEAIVIEENNLAIKLKDGANETAKKEAGVSLLEIFKNYGIAPEKYAAVSVEIKEPSGFWSWAGIVLPILLPIAMIGVFLFFMLRNVQRGSMQAFTFGKTQARMISPDSKKDRITFENVAGAKEAKEELKEIVDFLKNPAKFWKIGARIPRGVLLMGAPGTGKTLLARAVAGEARVPFFHISGSEFVEMFVGVGASRVRDLFKLAKKASPAIIFIDEIDAVGRQRGAGLGGGNDEREQTLNQILVEMDGFETNESVIVMAATNRPDVLDPALLRPGRFDRRVILDEPDLKDREEILRIHSKSKPLAADVNFRRLAERTPGFSGADLANLVNEGAIFAARQNKKTVGQNDLIASIEKVLLGPERKSHILSEQEKEIAAYHEAGHALVAASMKFSDPVHKVSIISRGRAAGYTLKLPTQDRHLYSKSYFLSELAVLLGGYAAEKFLFNEITTGASNDLGKATELARRMITKYGMSEKLGPMTFGDSGELVFLGKEITAQKNYSEEAAAKIDEEVRRFIDGAYKTAKKVLTEKTGKLREIAKKLVEQESIERDEFEAMIAPVV